MHFLQFSFQENTEKGLSAKERGTEITLLQFKEEMFVKKKYWIKINLSPRAREIPGRILDLKALEYSWRSWMAFESPGRSI